MIQILAGENTYFIKQRLEALGSLITKINGEKIAISELLDLIGAQSLFSEKRTIVISKLSTNKPAWDKITELIDEIKADVDLNLILVENKPDGRSKLIKQAKKEGWLEEFALPKNSFEAAKLLESEAKKLGIKFQTGVAKMIVDRVGVEMWAGYEAFEKLSVLDQNITPELVEKYIAPSLEVDVFALMDEVFARKADIVSGHLDQMERTGVNCFQFFGLVTSQISNLLLIKMLGREAAQESAKIHPFAASKLESVADQYNLEQIKQLIKILTVTDLKIKTTSIKDWELVKIGLLEIIYILDKK